MEPIPRECIAAVDVIVAKDTSEVGLLSKWNQIADVLVRYNLAMFEMIHPNQMLCHPSNRGKLGLNAAGSHRLVLRIKTVGGDKRELARATCFQLSTIPSKRDAQLLFNKSLVARADGLLAPVAGTERFLSVSCGHTASGCKAAIAGCRTDIPKLRDQSGNMDVKLIAGADKVLADMLTEGWKYLVVDSRVEERHGICVYECCRCVVCVLDVQALTLSIDISNMLAMLSPPPP
jgi:hypothetical protein